MRMLYLGAFDPSGRRNSATSTAAVLFQTQQTLLDVVYVLVGRGELEQARAWWDRLAAGAEPEDPQLIALTRTTEAVVLRAEGATGEALALVDRVIAERDRSAITNVHSKLAVEEVLECALTLGERTRVEQVLSVLDGLRPAELTPLYRGMRARFRGRLTDGPEAWAHFREAEQAYEGLGADFYVAVTRLEHAESLTLHGRSDEAEALQAAARAVFERLGAKPWLERADRVQARERVSA